MTNMPSRENGPYFLNPSCVVGLSGCFRPSLFDAGKDVFAYKALQCSRLYPRASGWKRKDSFTVWTEPCCKPSLCWALSHIWSQPPGPPLELGASAGSSRAAIENRPRGRAPSLASRETCPLLRVRMGMGRRSPAWREAAETKVGQAPGGLCPGLMRHRGLPGSRQALGVGGGGRVRPKRTAGPRSSGGAVGPPEGEWPSSVLGAELVSLTAWGVEAGGSTAGTERQGGGHSCGSRCGSIGGQGVAAMSGVIGR